MGGDPRGYSRSGGFSGLNPWGQKQVKQWLGYMQPQSAFSNYQNAVSALNNSAPLIDQQRKLMNEQWQMDIAPTIQNTFANAANRFTGMGTEGSSISNNWMSAFGNQMGRAGLSQQNAANQWAASQNMAMLDKREQANRTYAAMLADLLGLTRSQSQSSYSINDLPNDLQIGNPNSGT